MYDIIYVQHKERIYPTERCEKNPPNASKIDKLSMRKKTNETPADQIRRYTSNGKIQEIVFNEWLNVMTERGNLHFAVGDHSWVC